MGKRPTLRSVRHSCLDSDRTTTVFDSTVASLGAGVSQHRVG